MKTRITIVAAILLALFLVGEAVAQVPSSVTQQLRLSTGTATPQYVNHRAITSVGAAPAANGWYAWDQVPDRAVPANQGSNILFLNNANEVRQGTVFTATEANFIVTINPAGNNFAYLDPANLIIAQNGLTEPTANTVELGGPLTHNTNINLSTFDMEFLGTGNFNVGDGTATLNVNIDPGAGGFLNLQNIDASVLPDETFLMLDATGNVVSRQLAGLIAADNGLTETVVAGVSTISLGSAGPSGSGAPLLTDRFIAMGGNDLSFEGIGSVNLGSGADFSVNINTGTAGNLTLAGTTLDPVAPVAANFLYTDGAGNVRRADASTIPTGTAATYLAVDATGNIVNAPDPLGGIFRGRVNGDGTHDYTVAVPGLLAGAAVTCTVVNATGAGTISVQVTSVGANTFDIECAENIQVGSSISWIAMNP